MFHAGCVVDQDPEPDPDFDPDPDLDPDPYPDPSPALVEVMFHAGRLADPYLGRSLQQLGISERHDKNVVFEILLHIGVVLVLVIF